MANSERSLRASEIKDALLDQVEKYEEDLELEEVGEVLEVKDGIARIWGLTSAVSNEMLEIESSETGETVTALALNLEEDNIGAVILGDWLGIREGDDVRRTGRVLQVPAGDEFVGRVVNPLGEPLDGQGPIQGDDRMKVEEKAPGIVYRQPVDVPLHTGLKSIDSMIPIGRGQRELIIGDRRTGKTAIAIDAIINQRDSDVKCVYVAVGQKASTVAGVVERLKDEGAMDYTTVVAANASDPTTMQYIAPYAGCAMAEYFMYKQGEDTLVVYDDLSKQADAYREMSLILRRPPGREAYPGDVFYLHSRLLERSAKINEDPEVVEDHDLIEEPGGSLTALPIIQTQEGDVSAFIPTNVISITDGQIYLETDLFYQGVRPAVDVGTSVSRVGGDAQIDAMNDVAGQLRLELAQYRELEDFAQFGSDLDPATQRQLARGERTVEILKQDQYDPMAIEEQIMVIFAATEGFLDDVDVSEIKGWESSFLEFMGSTHPDVGDRIREGQELTEEIESDLRSAIEEFKNRYRSRQAEDAGVDEQEERLEEAEETEASDAAERAVSPTGSG